MQLDTSYLIAGLIALQVITDERANRMRIIAPIMGLSVNQDRKVQAHEDCSKTNQGCMVGRLCRLFPPLVVAFLDLETDLS